MTVGTGETFILHGGVPAFDAPAITAKIMKPVAVPSSKDGVIWSWEYVVEKVQVSIIPWAMMEKTF